MKTIFSLNLRTRNPLNLRECWQVKHSRAKLHRRVAWLCLAPPLYSWRSGPLGGQPLIVTLTRVAPRQLDSDGLICSLKAVRDGVADALGRDDSQKSGIEWKYAQRRGARREYSVEIVIDTSRGM